MKGMGNYWHVLHMVVLMLLLTGFFSVSASHGAGFVDAASLATARSGHTATLLPNGKVLVAGGSDYSGVAASAELYDPAGNSWSAAGSMGGARSGHTATLLPNGRVLVVGNGAELYDPASNSWSTAGSMGVARSGHTATLLPDGRVLVAGGRGDSSELASAELYDPVGNTWIAVGSMGNARILHTATMLPGGRVLVSGGFNSNSRELATAELYDPAGNSWSSAGVMSVVRIMHTATLLPGGRVLVAGGHGEGLLLNDSSELYDPVDNSWSSPESMNAAPWKHTATLLPSGKVLVTGGMGDDYAQKVAELYDPVTNSWSLVGYMGKARSSHTATLLPGGKILVVGGADPFYGPYSLVSAEIYDPATPVWSATGSMGPQKAYHSTILLPNGKVLVAGGRSGDMASAAVSLYEPTTNTWTAGGSMNDSRPDPTLTLMPGGKVLVAGSGSYTNSAELYDSTSNTWISAGSMSNYHWEHTATLLPNGKVLVAGGNSNSVELYDPASNTWSTAGNLGGSRRAHTATLLPNGKVLVTGGYDAGALASAELYDPASNTWSTAGSLGNARLYHTATLLPNGKVLVTGGYNSGFLASAELYDPADNTWSAAGSLGVARSGHTATLLPSGKVLAAGGSNNGYLASAELYDPATNTWSSAGSMIDARSDHSETLLASGKVLVVGGHGYSYDELSSVELFDPGLGFSDSRRPVISSATFVGTKLVMSGSGFRGDSEASDGSANSSATNYPLVQLQRVDGDQTRFLLSDPETEWSATTFTSGSVYGLPIGHYLVTVHANAVPSMAGLVLVAPAAVPSATSLDFGTVSTGTPPVSQIVTITNNGAVDLIVAPGSTPAPFTLNGGPSTVPSGASATYSVTLPTGSVGSYSGSLVFTTNDPSSPAISLNLSGSVTVESYLLSLSVVGPAGIVHSSPPPDMYCTGACGQSYASGTVVTLTAQTGIGYSFGGWSGDCSGNALSCQVTMDMMRSVTATFVQSTEFTNAANLATARSGHTATLLPNGKVLVAGGKEYYSAVASAELYDPASNSWSTAGSMGVARSGHTATLLPNGKVLVVGSGAELYDPAGNSWSTAGTMGVARSGHTATLLPNGKVLVAGGSVGGGELASAELYAPASNTWTPVGNMGTARILHTATLLPSGKVLVAGGFNSSSRELATAELYDPVSNSWLPAGSMGAVRERHTATLLPDGRVLVAWGHGEDLIVHISSELYNPVDNSWSSLESMGGGAFSHTATLLPSGKVIVLGGMIDDSESSANLYDPVTGSWSHGFMGKARTGHTATLLPGGKVLVVGGYDSYYGPFGLASAEIYDSATPGWLIAGSMDAPRSGFTATLLPSGKVLVAGGSGNVGVNASAELFDPAINIWSSAGSMNNARNSHTATLLPNGKILVTGGYNGDYLALAEMYNPTSNSWSSAGSMNVTRSGHTATLLSNGKVLVAGGGSGKSAELYDPATNTWALAGIMNASREGHTATLLSNGKVLVAGGYDLNSAYLATSELYDPASNTWLPAGDMSVVRFWHTATLMLSGKVLVAGGVNSSTSELYDPASNTWSPAGSMSIPRSLFAATLLPSGKVLVTGGSVVDSAELYDPVSSAWSSAGSMSNARESHTALLLPGGKVLVVGGDNAMSAYRSAELFDPGLGFSDSSRPVIFSATFVGTKLVMSGSGFRGNSEASDGSANSSATNYPLVQLQRVDGDQTRFLLSDPETEWSTTTFTASSVYGLPIGHYLVTVHANAVPSMAGLVLVAPAAAPSATSLYLGSVATGTLPVPKAVTITNNGAADLIVTPGSVPAPFSLSGGGATVPPGASATYSVTLPTGSVGSYSGSLVFTTNDPSSPTIHLNLSGSVTSTVTGVTLDPGVASPQATGTPITFTATGHGGSGAYEYRFWINSGSGFKIVRDYSAVNTYTWTPSSAGAYDILVDVRNAGSTAMRDASVKYFYYRILPPVATEVAITPNVNSPQAAGSTITFTATGQGGSGSYEYRFWINSGAGFAIVQDYSPANILVWTPTLVGAYDILVDARKAGSTAVREASKKIFYYQVVSATSTGVTLTPNAAAPQPLGRTVIFTAQGAGGSGVYEYRFWINSGSGFTMVQDFSLLNTLSWTPTVTGAYDILVDMRNAGSASLREASTKLFYYRIVAAPASGVTISPDLASPRPAGTTITFTANGQGGSGSYAYRFWLNSGSGYNIVQGYSATNTFSWTPSTPGAYDILVDVRNAGSTAFREAYKNVYYFQIQ